MLKGGAYELFNALLKKMEACPAALEVSSAKAAEPYKLEGEEKLQAILYWRESSFTLDFLSALELKLADFLADYKKTDSFVLAKPANKATKSNADSTKGLKASVKTDTRH